jgi:2-iminobutanoate/2-iminopropanoate deaminase
MNPKHARRELDFGRPEPQGQLEDKMKPLSNFRRTLLLLSAVAITVVPAWQHSSAQQHKAVNLSSANNLPFSDGIVAGNTLYISGQQGLDASGKLVAGGIGPETKTTLETIEKVVKAAGFELNDIVSVNVYLADARDFDAMNKVYREVFATNPPVRATTQADLMLRDGLIEISAIAARPELPRPED